MPTLLLNICQIPVVPYKQAGILLSQALGQAHTGAAVIAWEEPPGILVSFMLEDDTKPRTLPKAGHVCPAPLLQGPFPRCR